MAPLAMQQIAENMSLDGQMQRSLTFEDVKSKARMKALGCFFVGFSAGAAMAVRFGHLMPRIMRNFITLPTLLGAGSGAAAHQHSMKDAPPALAAAAAAPSAMPPRQVPALRKRKPLSFIIDFYGIQVQFHKT